MLVADEPHPPNATAIGEGEVAPVWLELPSRRLVLDAAIVPLERGIALLARLVGLAVLIEASDGEPGPISTGLTSLGVDTNPRTVIE